MTTVESRIKNAACEYIDLDEAEKDTYRGAGWMLARFEAGALVELCDPLNMPSCDTAQQAADAALPAALDWLRSANGEVWLVLCSCYQLCEPRRITINDASALAYLARRIGQALREAYYG